MFLTSGKKYYAPTQTYAKRNRYIVNGIFKDNTYDTRSDFQRLGLYTESIAGNILRKLIDKRKLKKERNRYSPFYIP